MAHVICCPIHFVSIEAQHASQELTVDAKLLRIVEHLVGIRGLAVLFVYIYHMNRRWAGRPRRDRIQPGNREAVIVGCSHAPPRMPGVMVGH